MAEKIEILTGLRLNAGPHFKLSSSQGFDRLLCLRVVWVRHSDDKLSNAAALESLTNILDLRVLGF